MAEWLVDSLVGFLKSPVWKYPVESFIEQNCVVFDPGDENKFSYTEVHTEYKRVVEGLLEGFMSELGLSAEQLAVAYTHSGEPGKDKENERLLEQILAAEDFLVFKSIMVQKNIDLELQALTVLQRQLGHSPEAYKYGRSGPAPNKEDDEVFDRVLKQSKAEYDLQRSLDEEELGKLLEMTKEESLRLHEASQKEQQSRADSLSGAAQLSVGESCSKKEKQKETTTQKADSGSKHRDDKLPALPPVKPPPSAQQPLTNVCPPRKASGSTKLSPAGLSGSDAAAAWLQNAKSELKTDDSAQTQKVAIMNPDDLKARAAYLRQQRDRLLAMKKERRAEELDMFTSSSSSQSAAPRAHSVQLAGSTSERPGSNKESRSSLSPQKRGNSTGILCSAIAGKLKKELEQS